MRDARITRTRSVNAFVESREDLGGLEGGHIEEAAPNFGRGEAAGREACDDTEVVGAAFEGARQRSGLVDAEAEAIEPEARTIS